MAADGDSVVVATEAGVTWLEQQEWTLARKAAEFEKILVSRHDRHGMTAECKMSGFGNLSSCISGDSDNNGQSHDTSMASHMTHQWPVT